MRSSSQSELPEPIECSIPDSDEDGEDRPPIFTVRWGESLLQFLRSVCSFAPASVQEWRAELTSRAARILARNNSGDMGLEMMAPMFNMLAVEVGARAGPA